MATCPDICPSAEKKRPKIYKIAGESRNSENTHARCYLPGEVQPREPPTYPKGAPPVYLPQPTDSASGDILGMSPVGPWAGGHLDWTPQAGMTGVRPVVDNYSMTRYSTGQWRSNNYNVLYAGVTDKGREVEAKIKAEMADNVKTLDKKTKESNDMLSKRIKDLAACRKKVRHALNAITEEIDTLDVCRAKIKGACRILMMPAAISKECLEMRTNRLEPDLVRDDAEQELIREVAIVDEIRRVFTETLRKAEKTMEELKAAKLRIEFDWSDKNVSLNLDKINHSLSPESSLILWHPGVARWTENSTSLEYWEHFSADSVKNCDEIRKKSEGLRDALMEAIAKGSQDMKTQCERTNQALAETVKATNEMCADLENKLKKNLQMIADIEKLYDFLQDSLRDYDKRNKVVMTRLMTRNYERPGVESCRDEAQYALMAEAKLIKEKTQELYDNLRQATIIRAELMVYRGQLEKQIAVKRKSCLIDDDRCSRLRAFMPTPEEFAAG